MKTLKTEPASSLLYAPAPFVDAATGEAFSCVTGRKLTPVEYAEIMASRAKRPVKFVTGAHQLLTAEERAAGTLSIRVA